MALPDLERIAASVVGQVRSRLELLSVEWQEEKIRLGHVLLCAACAIFFVQLAVVMLSIALVVVFWDTAMRVPVIGVVGVAALAGAWLSWRALRASLSDRPRAFEASIGELRRDQRALDLPP